MLEVGQTIGNYRVVRRLGQGAMGAVFEARHVMIDRRTAIKVPTNELGGDPAFVARFLDEARAANRVRHPGLLEIYEFGQLPSGPPYLIMELLEGESLSRRIEQSGGRLPQAAALSVSLQIAGGLAAAHRHGIVHRDLKPGNVMLVGDPESPGSERIKVFDFGIARMTANDEVAAIQRTETGRVVGTPAYMAPEQCMGAARIDGQADVYALGVMLYEMLAGRRPFVAPYAVELMTMHIEAPPPPLEERTEGVDGAVIMLVNQMLAKHPAQRPAMQEVAEELGRILASDRRRRADAAESSGGAAVNTLSAARAPTSGDLGCPFVVGPPIRDPRRFFGRERVLRRLAGLWRRAPLQNAAVLGSRRSGKTSLLLHLRDYVAGLPAESWSSSPPRFCYVDFQDPRLGTRDGLLRHLLRGLSLTTDRGGPLTMEHFIDVVAGNLRAPTVVLLDEVGVALARHHELDDTFWEALRAVATNQVDGRLAFVLASHGEPGELARQSNHGSPFFNIFGFTTTIGPFTDEEAGALIDSSPLPIAPPDRAFILEQSGRWPILLQLLCRERFVSLQESEAGEAGVTGEAGTGWREEALQQLEPFRHLLGRGD